MVRLCDEMRKPGVYFINAAFKSARFRTFDYDIISIKKFSLAFLKDNQTESVICKITIKFLPSVSMTFCYRLRCCTSDIVVLIRLLLGHTSRKRKTNQGMSSEQVHTLGVINNRTGAKTGPKTTLGYYYITLKV